MVIVYADGGCNPNPGIGRYGLAVFQNDRLLTKFGHTIGHATCNIAEWRACIAALDYITAIGVTEAELRMDSKLVINQLTAKWRVKNEGLAPYVREGQRVWFELRRKGVNVRAKWVPRERNEHADSMTR